MSNNFFKFKHFIVFQEHCAMKVGTDGVLLGAWCNVKACNNVLDVGTGTGLIALMIAQRNANAYIKAVDIDDDCVLQAQQNVARSQLALQINVEKISFQEHVMTTDTRYDLIVSNPPYFQNSLKSPCHSRSNARHNVTLLFFEIIAKGAPLLKEGGRIALILPHEFKQAVIDYAVKADLFVNRITNVFPLSHKPAKRLLIELTNIETVCVEDDLTIELSRHLYTDEFKALTHEFYLER